MVEFFFQDSLSAVWVRPNLGKGFKGGRKKEEIIGCELTGNI